ncbi:MAG: D-alanine--D-alanine ligase [Bifidobacteriaceae bacterium]|nr:D-alanine--D-alanine ligase [Bifidobacteriaceae bacterium]
MRKITNKEVIGVIYGGKSPEHNVSITSAKNICKGLDAAGFETVPFYINEKGNWFIQNPNVQNPHDKTGKSLTDKNIIKELKKSNSAFIAVHGNTGEDGQIAGFLQTLGVKYIGCGIESSAICFDKHRTKLALQARGIPIAPYLHIDIRDGFSFIEEYLNTKLDKTFFPCFIKPCRSGSSYGVTKAQNFEEVLKGIKTASKYDYSILIEKAIIGREIECAVIEGETANMPKISLPAEIGIQNSENSFYSTAAKYENDSVPLTAPANLNTEQVKIIQSTAATSYAVLECQSLARIDMFLTPNNQAIVNEVNTIPGFTPISQYPKMWEVSGLDLSNLLKELIKTAH